MMRRSISWLARSVAMAAAIAVAYLAGFRKTVPSSPPPPPAATMADEETIDKLLARERAMSPRSWWLEATIALGIALLATTWVVIGRVGQPTLVLVHDLREGDAIRVDDVVPIRLPLLEHTFSSAIELNEMFAGRDLAGGSVVRYSDVARPQAVATTDIAVGAILDPAKNIAYKTLPFAADAVTPAARSGKAARRFIVAGSLIRDRFTIDASDTSRPATPTKAEEIEIPLRAYSGGLRPATESEIILVATPREDGGSAVFEHVRVRSIGEGAAEPVGLVVVMKRADALRFAALPASEYTIMRRR